MIRKKPRLSGKSWLKNKRKTSQQVAKQCRLTASSKWIEKQFVPRIPDLGTTSCFGRGKRSDNLILPRLLAQFLSCPLHPRLINEFLFPLLPLILSHHEQI